jgi:hypothetical protein
MAIGFRRLNCDTKCIQGEGMKSYNFLIKKLFMAGHNSYSTIFKFSASILLHSKFLEFQFPAMINYEAQSVNLQV